MSDFRISQAAVTGSDMVSLVDTCQNTTVGPNKYQLYCVTRSNLNGQCTALPSTYTSAGKLNCVTVTSQTFLRSLYDSTGMACAINCYYPLSVDLPTFSIPPLPSFSFPSYTFSSGRSTPTAGSNAGNSDGNDLSDILNGGGDNSGSGNSGSGSNGNGNGPTIGSVGIGNGTASSASKLVATDPNNFMFTFMAVFAIMLLFFRRAL